MNSRFFRDANLQHSPHLLKPQEQFLYRVFELILHKGKLRFNDYIC